MVEFINKFYEFVIKFWWLPLVVIGLILILITAFIVIKLYQYYRNIRKEEYIKNHPDTEFNLKIRKGFIVSDNDDEEIEELEEDEEEEDY